MSELKGHRVLNLRNVARFFVAPAVVVALAGTSLAAEEMVDHPGYVAWSKHKPGTVLNMQTATETDDKDVGTITMTISTKLVEVTPAKVVIEATVTMPAAMGGKTVPGPKTDIPARIEKSKLDQAIMSPGDGPKPKIKSRKSGTGTVEVAGKKHDAKTEEFEFEIDQGEEKMTGTSKLWLVTEVPGGVAKSVMNIVKPKMTVTLTVTGVTAGK